MLVYAPSAEGEQGKWCGQRPDSSVGLPFRPEQPAPTMDVRRNNHARRRALTSSAIVLIALAAAAVAVTASSRVADDHADTPSGATSIAVGESRLGALNDEFDLDVFAFAAQEGVTYEFDVALGTLLDSVVYVLSAGGERLGYNDDIGDSWASRLKWIAPAAGTYYVVVGAKNRADRGTYILTMTLFRSLDDHDRADAGATPIGLAEAVPGELEYQHDVDAFIFEAEQGLIYEIDVSLGTLPDSYLSLDVFMGRDLASNDDHGDSQASRIVWKAEASGRYVVKVQGRGTGTYTLTVNVAETAQDDAASAPLILGESVHASLDHYDDVDVYPIQAEAGVYYQVELALDGLSDGIVLVGLGDDLHDLLSSRAGFAFARAEPGTGTITLIWKAPATATGALALLNQSGATGGYVLTVSVIDLVDDYANTVSGASAVGLGEPRPAAREYDNDLDLFSFEAKAGTRYRIDAISSTLSTTKLTLQEFNGRELASESNDEDYEDLPIFWKAPADGRYYVAADGRGTGEYTLLITTVVDDHADELSAATILPVGGAVEGALDHYYDGDAFVVEVEQGVVYEFGIKLGTLPNSSLRLQTPDGDQLAEDDDYQRDESSRIVWKAAAGGSLYLIVRHDNIGALGTYTLTAAVAELGDDQGNSPETATLARIGVPFTGELEYDNDLDVFRFRAEQGVLYQIDLERGTLGRYELTLQSADGRTLEGRFVWQAPAAGDYYLSLAGESRGTYTLTISAIDVADDHPRTRLEATPVALGEVVPGELDFPSDEDVFVFPARQGEIYAIDVAALGLREIPPVIEVGTLDEERSPFCTRYSTSRITRAFWRAPGSGNYYVSISGCGLEATGTYTLTITQVEDDHADTRSGATTVEVGQPVAGALDYDRDIDVFAFQAQRGVLYEIRTTDMTLRSSRLTAPCPEGLSRSRYIEARSSPIQWLAPASGTQYVCVSAYDRGSYTFSVSRSPIVDDHGSTPRAATALALGQTVDGVLDYDGDLDVFVFEAEQGVIYEIDTALGTLSNSVISIETGNTCRLNRERHRYDPRGSRIVWKAWSTSTHFVCVGGDGSGGYSLTVAVSEVADDHGDTYSEATPAALGQPVEGAGQFDNDIDIFVFQAEAGVAYKIDLVSATGSNLQVYVVDHERKRLDSDGWEAAVSGDYYVIVGGLDNASYSLTVSLNPDQQ